MVGLSLCDPLPECSPATYRALACIPLVSSSLFVYALISCFPASSGASMTSTEGNRRLQPYAPLLLSAPSPLCTEWRATLRRFYWGWVMVTSTVSPDHCCCPSPPPAQSGGLPGLLPRVGGQYHQGRPAECDPHGFVRAAQEHVGDKEGQDRHVEVHLGETAGSEGGEGGTPIETAGSEGGKGGTPIETLSGPARRLQL